LIRRRSRIFDVIAEHRDGHTVNFCVVLGKELKQIVIAEVTQLGFITGSVKTARVIDAASMQAFEGAPISGRR